ncbi:MAG: hypothetical protein ACLFN8_03045 [Candidatus Woesearchaeota archaeon]
MVRHYTQLLFITLLILLVPTLAQSITININPDQTKQENVYFEICEANTEFNLEISCVEEYTKTIWQNNCNMIAFKPQDIICDDITVKVEYDNETKEKKIEFNDYKTALIQSLNTPHTQDPINNAIKIYGYTLLDMEDDANNLLEVLKLTRDNEEKCWPQQKCDLYETVEVLKYLSKAGYGLENRVYYDALLWVEFHQNKIENEDWILTILPHRTPAVDEEVTCRAMLDTTTIDTFTLTRNNTRTDYRFDYRAGTELNVTCDARFKVYIKNYFGDVLLESWDYADNTVSFFMEGGCWSEDKPDWDVYDGTLIRGKDISCAPGITEKTLLLNDLSDDAKSDGITWLEGEINRARIAGKQISNNREILNNINAYRATQDENVKRWVLFTQNNIGSFGPDHSIITTLSAIETFTDITDKSWRDDAINWVLDTREETGWTTLLENTLGYKVFMHEFTPILMNPTILYFDDNINFEIIAEKEYEYYLSESLKDKVSIDIDTETGAGVARRLISEDGLITGKLILKTDDAFKEFPVISYKKPIIDFKFEKEYYFTEQEDTIIVDVEKSESNFNCELQFSDFFENTTIQDANERIFLNYYYTEEFSDEIEINAICQSPDYNITESYKTHIRRYDYAPFEIRKIQQNTETEPGYFTLKNNIDENYTLNMRWLAQANTYPLPEKLELDNRNLRVYVYQQLPHTELEEDTNTLRLEALGYILDEPYTYTLHENAMDFNETHKYITPFPTKTTIIIFLGIIILTLFSLLTRFTLKKIKQKREKIKQEREKAKAEELEKNKPNLLKKVKPKQTNKEPLMDVLVAIDKTLNESEDEIETELKDEGFNSDEIRKALKDVEKYMKKKKIDKTQTTDKKIETITDTKTT